MINWIPFKPLPQSHRFSADFENAFKNNESKFLDIHRYESCLTEFVNKHEKLMVFSTTKTLVLFAAGMWAVYAGAVFWAVLLLAMCAAGRAVLKWKVVRRGLVNGVVGCY